MFSLLKKFYQYLFFGGIRKWYLELTVDDDNRAAVLKWLDDRNRFHVWITSLITGAIIFLTTLTPNLSNSSESGLPMLIGVGLMLFSVVINIICIWSLTNYSLNVSRKLVSDGTSMRVDLEIMAFIAILSFLVGLSLAVMGVVLA